MELITDPREIKEDKFPFMVFSDHTSGLLEWIIKVRTTAQVNHAMWAHKPGYFASQGGTYSEVKMERYLKKGNRLYFVELKDFTLPQRQAILNSINEKLRLPWVKKRYDYLGLVGQAMGFKWINTPWLEYCSEDQPQHLKKKINNFSEEMQPIIRDIPYHAHPQQLMDYYKQYPKLFNLFGYWDGELNPIINKRPIDDRIMLSLGRQPL